MSGYGQFCPVAKAMELLDERWTMLVVRELLAGSRQFNDLRRGVPKMSPALLSKRLKSLTRARRHRTCRNRWRAPRRHSPTAARSSPRSSRRSARGACGGSASSARRTSIPHLLMWDIRRTIPVAEWPRTRTAVAFRLDGVASESVALVAWWSADGEADVCDFDPGYEVTGTVETSLRTLTRIWRGDVAWSHALLRRRRRVSGPAEARRAIPAWIGQSALSAVPRPRVRPFGAQGLDDMVGDGRHPRPYAISAR